MLISVFKRFIFVANSKTASTSVERALLDYAEINRGGNPKRKHTFLRDALNEYYFLFDRPEYASDTFFKFGVMREPLDWIQSWYRYRTGNKIPGSLPSDMTFKEFWEHRDWNIIREGTGNKHLQRDYFLSSDGKILADYIIPYHELDSHLEKICDAMGLDVTVPKLNVSLRKEIDGELGPLAEEMKSFYEEDYELFNSLQQINESGMKKLRERTSG